MLREDREDLELENLSVTNHKCLAETRKLNAEEKKIKREALLYPFVVGAGLLNALVTLFTVLDR